MFRISLNRVRDRIVVEEGSDTLKMVVDCDATAIVTRIRKANESMIGVLKDGHTDEERNRAARAFSEAIFGEEQTDRLVAFYGGDYSCVAALCGKYFQERLTKKIVAVQKKIKK